MDSQRFVVRKTKTPLRMCGCTDRLETRCMRKPTVPYTGSRLLHLFLLNDLKLSPTFLHTGTHVQVWSKGDNKTAKLETFSFSYDVCQ